MRRRATTQNCAEQNSATNVSTHLDLRYLKHDSRPTPSSETPAASQPVHPRSPRDPTPPSPRTQGSVRSPSIRVAIVATPPMAGYTPLPSAVPSSGPRRRPNRVRQHYAPSGRLTVSGVGARWAFDLVRRSRPHAVSAGFHTANALGTRCSRSVKTTAAWPVAPHVIRSPLATQSTERVAPWITN